MIEIRGKFDKSNTFLKFRCVIFCLALFRHELHQTTEEVQHEIKPNEISRM